MHAARCTLLGTCPRRCRRRHSQCVQRAGGQQRAGGRQVHAQRALLGLAGKRPALSLRPLPGRRAPLHCTPFSGATFAALRASSQCALARSPDATARRSLARRAPSPSWPWPRPRTCASTPSTSPWPTSSSRCPAEPTTTTTPTPRSWRRSRRAPASTPCGPDGACTVPRAPSRALHRAPLSLLPAHQALEEQRADACGGEGCLLRRRGHASENPELPTLLAERGITFLGPPARAMAALGDKVRPRVHLRSPRDPAAALLPLLRLGCWLPELSERLPSVRAWQGVARRGGAGCVRARGARRLAAPS